MTGADVEVAIVGGGAAGIGAARRLREAGVRALILEARDRLGGRAWTVEAGGYAIDSVVAGCIQPSEIRGRRSPRRKAGRSTAPRRRGRARRRSRD